MTLTITIETEDGRVVFSREEERTIAGPAGGRGALRIGAQLPLKDLAAGIYSLKVEARLHLNRPAVVSRRTSFRVTTLASTPDFQANPDL